MRCTISHLIIVIVFIYVKGIDVLCNVTCIIRCNVLLQLLYEALLRLARVAVDDGHAY